MTGLARIPVAAPTLGDSERAYVLDCIDSNWISSNGKYIGEFEAQFADFCGVKHALATNNGTTALHLALVALGLGTGDEVILPTVTYVATANAVHYCGATPVFVDSEFPTLNMDTQLLEKAITPHTKGIIPVHLYGHPVDMDAVRAVAQAHGLWVVEDAAEAHGAEVRGRRVGGLGTAASFSFYANKIITTGEGGIVTTDDPELAATLRLLRGQGMDPEWRYWFPIIGFNYRMTNIQAAIGVGQMQRVDHNLLRRRQISEWYASALADVADSLVLPTVAPWARDVVWMYTVYIRHGDHRKRDVLMGAMDTDGIETRPVFYPMHLMPPYRQATRFPIADTWACRGINLPTHLQLTAADIDRVADSLRRHLAV